MAGIPTITLPPIIIKPEAFTFEPLITTIGNLSFQDALTSFMNDIAITFTMPKFSFSSVPEIKKAQNRVFELYDVCFPPEYSYVKGHALRAIKDPFYLNVLFGLNPPVAMETAAAARITITRALNIIAAEKIKEAERQAAIVASEKAAAAEKERARLEAEVEAKKILEAKRLQEEEAARQAKLKAEEEIRRKAEALEQKRIREEQEAKEKAEAEAKAKEQAEREIAKQKAIADREAQLKAIALEKERLIQEQARLKKERATASVAEGKRIFEEQQKVETQQLELFLKEFNLPAIEAAEPAITTAPTISKVTPEVPPITPTIPIPIEQKKPYELIPKFVTLGPPEKLIERLPAEDPSIIKERLIAELQNIEREGYPDEQDFLINQGLEQLIAELQEVGIVTQESDIEQITPEELQKQLLKQDQRWQELKEDIWTELGVTSPEEKEAWEYKRTVLAHRRQLKAAGKELTQPWLKQIVISEEQLAEKYKTVLEQAGRKREQLLAQLRAKSLIEEKQRLLNEAKQAQADRFRRAKLEQDSQKLRIEFLINQRKPITEEESKKELSLLQRVLKQEPGALEEFTNKYRRLIFKYIFSTYQYHGKKLSPEESEEVFQDVYITFLQDDFKKLRQFKGKNQASLASWIRILTINYCVSQLRKKQPILEELPEEKED